MGLLSHIGKAPVSGAEDFYSYPINESCMFDIVTSSCLYRTSNDGRAIRTKSTFSTWLKRSTINGASVRLFSFYADALNYYDGFFTSANKFNIYQKTGGVVSHTQLTDRVFRDCANWYHMFVRYDSTDATADDRMQIWVNGIRSILSGVNLSLNEEHCGNDDLTQGIGAFGTGTNEMSGYQAETHFCAELAQDVTDFGEFKNGVWIPKEYVGSHGDNGWHMDYAVPEDLGNDVSGNANDMIQLNLGVDHQVTDTPTNNHCTLDFNNRYWSALTWTEGALYLSNGANNHKAVAATMPMRTGKWYWEVECLNEGATRHGMTGILANDHRSGNIQIEPHYLGVDGYGFSLHAYTAENKYRKVWNNIGTDLDLGTVDIGDIMQIAFDADANKLWFGVNDSWTGDPGAGTDPDYSSAQGINTDRYDIVPATSCYNFTVLHNFGQHEFAHTPPSGFKALCSENLPEPSSLLFPLSKAVEIDLYTGNGAELVRSGFDFQPDFAWIKSRSAATSNVITDSERGVTKELKSDLSVVEATVAQGLKSFNVDGYTLGTDTDYNDNAETYFAWLLKRGAAYGVDIVTYTGNGVAGRTVSHGLGEIPEMIIVKERTNDAGSWWIYHFATRAKADPWTDVGQFDTSTWLDNDEFWDDTAPTSNLFTLGDHDDVNANGDTYVAYLFADVSGFSKVFSYIGNGNAYGPYIHCGFRPRIIMWKNSFLISSWRIYDTARNTVNGLTMNYLLPSTDSDEGQDGIIMDINSNGFKIISNSASINVVDDIYVGIAFAEQPFKYSNAR